MAQASDDMIKKAAIAILENPMINFTDIAKKLNISQPTLYNNFKNRDDVVLQIFLFFWKKVESAMQHLDSLNNLGEKPISQMNTLIALSLSLVSSDAEIVKFISNFGLKRPEAYEDEELREKRTSIRDKHYEILEKLDQLIGDAQKAGDISIEAKPQVIRQFLWGGILGLIYGLLISPKESMTYGYKDAFEFLAVLFKRLKSYPEEENSKVEGGDVNVQ
ncbi:MAG: TetR/AcrR family transcriptional regulator [Candidatus Paceibacterota bacterium]|jgi:AcrR family transcriptional regulator